MKSLTEVAGVGRRERVGLAPLLRLLLALAAPMGSGACTMVGGGAPPPGPSPLPGRDVETPATAEAVRITSGVVETALAAVGTPYVWGGTDANGFDCSGLIQYAYGEYGIELPRVSTDQIRSGRAVPLQPRLLRPGDILGFSLEDAGKTSHVGLYVGDGDFIHSSSSGVRTSSLQNRYWREHLVAARRLVS